MLGTVHEGKGLGGLFVSKEVYEMLVTAFVWFEVLSC